MEAGGRIVDAYTTEFLKFNRFAPILIAEERDGAHRFQQYLKLEIQKHMAMAVMGTYAEVPEVVRCQEQVTGMGKAKMEMQKRPIV